jgi:hypothetical protein
MAAVKIVKGKVIQDDVEFEVGEIVKGLSKKDLARLVKMGMGVEIDFPGDETPPDSPDKPHKLTRQEKADMRKDFLMEQAGIVKDETPVVAPKKQPNPKE